MVQYLIRKDCVWMKHSQILNKKIVHAGANFITTGTPSVSMYHQNICIDM